MKKKKTPEEKQKERLLILGSIAGAITKFDRRCSAEEHTDVGDAWQLLYAIRHDVKSLIKLEVK